MGFRETSAYYSIRYHDFTQSDARAAVAKINRQLAAPPPSVYD